MTATIASYVMETHDQHANFVATQDDPSHHLPARQDCNPYRELRQLRANGARWQVPGGPAPPGPRLVGRQWAGRTTYWRRHRSANVTGPRGPGRWSTLMPV